MVVPVYLILKAVSYSPDRVVSLAISKCQAGGMVTTEQNLLNNLNAGKITQEEYDEYYPLDGLEDSYYSVFKRAGISFWLIPALMMQSVFFYL